MKEFDYREINYLVRLRTRTVEFYFTKESNYKQCLERNPHCLVSEDLKPGHRIVYSFVQMRTPEYLLRVGKKKPYKPISDTQEALE